MRILAVSHTPIWPIRSGAAIRRLMTVEALAAFGSVDLLYVGEVRGCAQATPQDAPVGRVWEQPIRRVRPGALARARWLMRPSVPFELLEWARHPLQPPAGHAYDLVWHFRAVPHSLAPNVPGRTTVVDLDDLEDRKIRTAHTLRMPRRSARRRLAERRNLAAWVKYQRALSAQVDAVTVCHEADRRALGVENCHVVPNGFPRVRSGRTAEPRTPTVLLVGLFEYGPNADGAEFFVDHALPLIRRAVPACAVRLVGRDSARVRRLAGPGVTVVGEVPDLAPEYDRASVAVAPIRFGSGTRVKILEAFARRLPMVSTTLGAAGLGALHGEHLLLADDPASFAGACVSLLTGADLRRTLAANALALYEARFSQSAVTRAVGDVVSALGGSASGECAGVSPAPAMVC